MLLEAHSLRFECRALSPILTPPFKGSMIRGALFAALRRDFCLTPLSADCSEPRLRQACPVCCLLATADEESARGVEVARPCTIEPPLEARTRYDSGDLFSFGLTLYGQANQLLPYAILGVKSMAEAGVGNRYRAPGRFRVERIEAVNPVSGGRQVVYRQGDASVRRSDVRISHQDVLLAAETVGGSSEVTLDLLTPMRLIEDGRLVKTLSFPSLMRRTLRRLTDLTKTACGEHPGFDHRTLLAAAEDVRVAEDRTRWIDVPSYSSRQGRFTPIGGLMGRVTFEGDLRPFVPWLIWGSITHVGKDATKGGGWYRLRWQS